MSRIATVRHALLQRWHWLSTQWQDVIELWLVPAFFAVWPARLSWYGLQWASRCQSLYGASVQAALLQATAQGAVTDPKAWCRRRRLVTLLDHVDVYRSMWRPRWMKSFVTHNGPRPQPGQAQVVGTLHWGAGLWVLRALRQSGLKVHAMAAPLDSRYFPGRPIQWAYARMRMGHVSVLLGTPLLDVSQSMRPALQALRHQETVLAVLDVPADNFSSGAEVECYGSRWRVPEGVLRLVHERKYPLYLFTAGIGSFGSRYVQWLALPQASSQQECNQQVFDVLNRCIQEASADWHLWSEWPRFAGRPEN